ncbi:MAG TPA: hypothetical protein PLA97_13580 [Rubrivivax sp.]|nr:hypothetical protein [Rubrivivax sp.]
MSDDTSIPTTVRCAYDIRHQTPEHHAACLSYVRHRYKIKGPIAVTFPGSCGKAQPLPEWDEVRSNSLPVCACGRDRAVFPPLQVSPVPVGSLPASLPDPIVVAQEDQILIRSIQGAGHAHYSVAIEDGQLIVESDPIAGIGDLLLGGFADAEEPKIRTAALSELAASLSDGTKALPFCIQHEGHARLVFAVTAIDAPARRVSIRLGATMETVVPGDGMD